MAYARTWKGGVIPRFLMITSQVALVVKNLPANTGDTRDGSIHASKRSPGEGWQPTPVFVPRNPMDRGDWQTVVHRVTKSWTRLSTSIANLKPDSSNSKAFASNPQEHKTEVTTAAKNARLFELSRQQKHRMKSITGYQLPFF